MMRNMTKITMMSKIEVSHICTGGIQIVQNELEVELSK